MDNVWRIDLLDTPGFYAKLAETGLVLRLELPVKLVRDRFDEREILLQRALDIDFALFPLSFAKIENRVKTAGIGSGDFRDTLDRVALAPGSSFAQRDQSMKK